MTTAPIPDVDDVLTRVPGWNGRAHVVGALSGGITNRNVLVEVDGARFVLRVAGRDTNLLGIDRAVERIANQRASQLGIAPEVVAFVEPECFLVTRFVPGAALTPEQLAEPAWLTRACQALSAFHEAGPLPGTFDCFRIPHEHRLAAESRGVAVPAAYDRAAERAAEIEAAFGATPEPRRPCHNDLLAANFLADGDTLVVLDWEYAGMNDRFFDLGNLAANNDLDTDAQERLLTAYFGAASPRRRARLALMKIMSDFREAMWGVVQQGISTIDFDYAAYAASHFERLLGNAAAPGYRRHLADAADPE